MPTVIVEFVRAASILCRGRDKVGRKKERKLWR
jgi:hypothetical protein